MIRRRALAVLAGAALVVGACGGSGGAGEAAAPVGGGVAPSRVTDAAVSDATARGVQYLAAHLGEVDWANLGVVDYLARNWGVDALAGARELGQQLATSGQAGVEFPALGRLLFADQRPPAPGTPMDALPNPALVAPLYCDQRPVTDADLLALRMMLDDSAGYGATHVGLAVGWMRELGCGGPALDQLAADTATQIHGALDAYLAAVQDAAGEQGHTLEDLGGELWITDVAMEAAAVLAYLGDDGVVTQWAPYVVANQEADGGFATPEFGQDASHWHSTLVATWVLLAASGPGNGSPMVLASEDR